jgi:hypothetical protein
MPRGDWRGDFLLPYTSAMVQNAAKISYQFSGDAWLILISLLFSLYLRSHKPYEFIPCIYTKNQSMTKCALLQLLSRKKTALLTT